MKLSVSKRPRNSANSRSGRLYSAADLARELGVSKMTVLRWVSDGRLRQPRHYMLNSMGKVWLWDRDELSFATAFKKIQKRSKR